MPKAQIIIDIILYIQVQQLYMLIIIFINFLMVTKNELRKVFFQDSFFEFFLKLLTHSCLKKKRKK